MDIANLAVAEFAAHLPILSALPPAGAFPPREKNETAIPLNRPASILRGLFISVPARVVYVRRRLGEEKPVPNLTSF